MPVCVFKLLCHQSHTQLKQYWSVGLMTATRASTSLPSKPYAVKEILKQGLMRAVRARGGGKQGTLTPCEGLQGRGVTMAGRERQLDRRRNSLWGRHACFTGRWQNWVQGHHRNLIRVAKLLRFLAASSGIVFVVTVSHNCPWRHSTHYLLYTHTFWWWYRIAGYFQGVYILRISKLLRLIENHTHVHSVATSWVQSSQKFSFREIREIYTPQNNPLYSNNQPWNAKTFRRKRLKVTPQFSQLTSAFPL